MFDNCKVRNSSAVDVCCFLTIAKTTAGFKYLRPDLLILGIKILLLFRASKSVLSGKHILCMTDEVCEDSSLLGKSRNKLKASLGATPRIVHAEIGETYLHARSAAANYTNPFAFVLDVWCPSSAMQYLTFEITKARKFWRIRLVQNSKGSD